MSANHQAARPARILIVDDERHNRNLLDVMLTAEGFQLQTAATGEDALAMVAVQAPDLILLDVMMPGLDGYQVAARLKSTFATKNIPVIMITALGDRSSRVRGLDAGVEDFLIKPVDRGELCARTRNLLRRQDEMRFTDDFLSHVSHELRSPLTAIKQFTTILLGGLAGELNSEQREYQQIVLKNADQLQSMIDDLLEVTRLGTGKLVVEPERLCVPDAVTDALNTVDVTARGKGVTLSADLEPDLPSAHADPTRLRQILLILLDNALKFSSAGGVVTVQARRTHQEPEFLLLEVSDTGCGMSAEVAERIFDRLYQGSESSQASRKGLGLGLHICTELVDRQGGHIWVSSRPQQGSTFSFTLPALSSNTVQVSEAVNHA